MNFTKLFALALLIFTLSCNDDEVKPDDVGLNYKELLLNGVQTWSVSPVNPVIHVSFNYPIDRNSAQGNVLLYQNNTPVEVNVNFSNNDSTIIVESEVPLQYLQQVEFAITQSLKSTSGKFLQTTVRQFFSTGIDSTYKFPAISDDVLLTQIQSQTFKYFWDFGHPVSGMARERNTSGDLVTTGGTGFGVMSMIAGIHNNFISRQEGLQRITTIADFLTTKADRFHGVFPHWLNGITGKTIPFSAKDNGGDLVETSFLVVGLLCAKEYFDANTEGEIALRNKIQHIWETVEWNWHTKPNEKVLYWHWSPNFGFDLNLQLRGWNEALITYILAAASPTFPIDKEFYDKGWASNGNIKHNKSYYGINLPLGHSFGGPLFLSQYTFLGIDPRNLKDAYADYMEQQVNHTKINQQYCVTNPKKFYGYSDENWGLTASDTKGGYTAHSPTNDLGVISPTAALSAIVYLPEESLKAARFFYYVLGDRIYKNYGFVDAFSLHDLWFANSFLAIDQGPIIVMIENYKSGLIWQKTMQNQDIKNGLTKLGFTY